MTHTVNATTSTDQAHFSTKPMTGDEYLESLRDGREVWIYGERVDDVTTHPAFRNSARSIARFYDALHDPEMAPKLTRETDTGNGGFTHGFFRYARSREDLRFSQQAIRTWQELGYGWMGRTPDYKAALLTTLGADPDYFGEFSGNARRWYKEAQERVLHVGHAIVHPPVDRDRPADEVNDVFVHVERETDEGLVISGAKVVATGAPLTNYVWVSHNAVPHGKKEFSITFMAPINAKGVKLVSRASYEFAVATSGSPFDYPLSSRLDENDAILVFDEAVIPWECVLIYDANKVTDHHRTSGWQANAVFQAATRFVVKLDFLAGALSRALDITGAGQFRGVQEKLGEVISWRNMFDGLIKGMIEGAKPGFGGAWIPCSETAQAYVTVAPGVYRRIREIIEQSVASGLIYLNSNAVDFQNPQLRPVLDRYLRGSNGNEAIDRSRTMKLLWDAVGSEFGARHEHYELNYFAQPDINHLKNLGIAQETGELDRMRDLAGKAMSEYDLNGWTAPDLINPSDVTVVPGASK